MITHEAEREVIGAIHARGLALFQAATGSMRLASFGRRGLLMRRLTC